MIYLENYIIMKERRKREMVRAKKNGEYKKNMMQGTESCLEIEELDKEKRIFLISTWEYFRDCRGGGLVVVRNELKCITSVKGGQQDSDWERSTVNY